MNGALHVDTPTLALGGAVLVALALTYKLRPPPPQIHPFLLGRQSLPAPTRKEGESPVYASAANGGVRAPWRPDRTIRTLADILAKSQTCLEGGERGSWVRGGEKLIDLVAALHAGLVSKLTGVDGRVLVVVDDPTDAVLVTLALATSSFKPIIVAPGSAIPGTLNYVAVVKSSDREVNSGDAKFLDLGDKEAAQDVLATGRTLASEGKSAASAAGEAGDLALTIVSEGIPLDFTNQNLTASLVSWLSLFPASPQATKPTLKDSVLSFHHPSTPHGLGLALMVIYQSASLSFPALALTGLDDEEAAAKALCDILASKPPATLIFAPAATFDQPLYKLILQKILGDASIIVRQARDGKLRLLREGTVSKLTFWDSLLWKGLCKDIHLTSLRGLFVTATSPSTAVLQSHLDTFRCALGCPVVPLLSHGALLAPLASGNMWDVQRLPPPGTKALHGDERGHVGAVTAGMEIKLVGDEADMSAGRVRGEILLRTPLLPHPSSLPPALLQTDVSLPQLPPYPGQSAAAAPDEASKWLRTGVRAEMATEGTLWLLE
ncbi:hypothetical protein JCM3770_005516 [Rhodotorula araucariae]